MQASIVVPNWTDNHLWAVCCQDDYDIWCLLVICITGDCMEWFFVLFHM